ncbi:MAG: hypothetical protein WC783_05675 [Candidatus Paceibacterota bacterium]|jgi:hypothetical protein
MNKFFTNLNTHRNILTILLGLVLVVPLYRALAQPMQSATYKIQSDTVNVGGKDISTSSNYKLGDTAGELGTGDSSSSNYIMHAGFWQMQESFISLSTPSDLALTAIGGIAGEASEGTISWTVITDNLAGYSMSIQSVTSPALTSGSDSFADYTPAGADPDYNFSINPTTSAFGFSPEGVDVNTRFKDNGSACNTGSGEVVAKCWDGLSTSPKDAFLRTSSNQPSGSTATIRFRAESGPNHIQPAGSYSAPITVTAVTL